MVKISSFLSTYLKKTDFVNSMTIDISSIEVYEFLKNLFNVLNLLVLFVLTCIYTDFVCPSSYAFSPSILFSAIK